MSREIQKSMIAPAALFTLLGIQLFLSVPESVAIDSPHNSNNTAPISCLTCHDAALSAATPTWWTDQESNVCGQCHGPAGSAKEVFTHKTGTVVLVQCSQCHNPHNQQQNRVWTTQSYLYTGVSTSVTATTLMTAATWTVDCWKDHLLIPNTRYQSLNYRIAGNTANTITVVSQGIAPDNAIRATTYGKAGSTFAIVYGKLVKENVNGRNVKFFRQAGPNSFADEDAAIDGICQVCHTKTTSFRNSGLLEGAGHPSLQAGKKCSTCHQHESSFKANCKDCHGTPPLVNTIGGPNGLADHDGGTGSSDPGAHQKHVNQGYACETCHSCGMPYAPIEDTIYDKKIQIGFKIGEGRYQSGEYDGRNLLANGYMYTAGNAGTAITQSNTMTCRSVYCHTDGTAVATGSVPGSTSPDWANGTTSCNSCHGFPPNYASGSPKANSHGAHNYTCDNCHNTTTTTGNSITNSAAHANAVYDLAPGSGKNFVYSFSFPNGTCSTVSCHSNTGTTWGQSACLDCHSIRQGNRAAVQADFNGNSHHIQGTAVTGAKCYQCHWEANADGSINTLYHGGSGTPGSVVNLVIYGAGARPTTYAAGTTAVPYTANGTRSETGKITTHCLGCHSQQNNDTQPFGDGKTPRQYSWDGTSIELRYSQTGTTVWGKYSVANTTRKNFTKAYSAHGNAAANQRGWNTTTGTDTITDGNAANTSGSVNVQCFDCHNSHGSTVQGVTTRYTSATVNGGIIKDTTQDVGGYTVSYKPEAGGSQPDRNERNPGASLCLDCHLTQTAGSARPWGYNSTFGALQAIIGYWDSSLLAPGDAGPQQRYAYKIGKPATNKGGHFGKSSDLQSTPMQTIGGLCTPCHDPHGVSPGLGENNQYAVPLLKGTWVTSPYKEDAAPARNVAQTNFAGYGDGVGYHIDQNTFGSSIRDTVSGVTQTAGQFAGLCLTCHPQNTLTTPASCSNPAFTTMAACTANGGSWSPNTWKSKERIHESVKGWKTSDATVKHNYTCSKCHSPHNGSALPRLMVTNCLDSWHKGRTGFSFPVNSAAYSLSGDYGSGGGSGRIPGSYSGGGDDPLTTYFGMPVPGNMTVSCHESSTANGGNGLDQGWNVKTPWADFPPIAITTGPAAGQFSASGSNVQAIITWSTNVPGDSRVNFGLTSGYGATTTVNDSVLNHAVTIQNLTNHATIHYQAASAASDGQQTASADTTFYISVPPPVPSLITKPATTCASSCPVTLSWNPSADPDGGPVEYNVQISPNSWFDVISYDSGWVSGTTHTSSLSLSTNTTYFWRVRARDANHTGAQDPASAWQTTPGSFALHDDRPNITFYPVSNITASGTDITATIAWSTDKLSTSYVDYGGPASPPYSGTAGLDTPVTNHSVVIHNLTNHATNHYRVRSAGGAFNAEAVSTDRTFSVSLPPSVPVLIPESDSVCATSCPVTLEWNPSTDPDNGVIEYQAQISSSPTFIPVIADSAWLSVTNYTTQNNLSTGSTYYWRVRSRDVGYPAILSNWSTGSFKLTTAPTPSTPAVIGPGTYNYTTDCVNPVSVILQWNPVSAPDGDAVQYYVEILPLGSNTPLTNSGWIDSTTWSFSASTQSAYRWHVKARDAVHTDAESDYSALDSFWDFANCGGSCPMLYSWNGTDFSFEVDLYGPGKLGLKTANGYVKPNPNDFYLLANQPAPQQDGSLEFRLVEERSEVDYMDTVKLYTVDMPQNRDVYAELTPFALANVQQPDTVLHTVDRNLKPPLTTIHLNTGEDVSALLSSADRNYLVLSEDKNLFDWHTLEIDFGDLSQAPMLKLIIDAVSEFPTTSDGFARANAMSSSPDRTKLEVLDENGNWVLVPRSRVILSKPKEFRRPYIVNLTDIFQTNVYRIRLSFLYKTYIDAIFFDTTADEPVSINPVPLDTATLGYYGASATTGGEEIFEYRYGVQTARDYQYMPGNYTRYGDVKPLLQVTDDKPIIFGPGDEVRLTFKGAVTQPSGTIRRFLLYAHGYYKDFKNNSIIDKTVEPLPFDAMSNFPYDPGVEHYPDDADHNQYRTEYNTRTYP